MPKAIVWITLVSSLALSAMAADSGRDDWRAHREELEAFLLAAEVVREEEIPVGVTRPKRLTLEHEGKRARASWKTYNVMAARVVHEDGRSETNFRDSYKHELAAYELDKILGLDLVPPTVLRKIGKEVGALRIWVEDSMTEAERLRSRIPPPDEDDWVRQMQAIRLFYGLINNTDYKNVSNLVIDRDFRISTIDLSRAFGVKKELVWGDRLGQVSRPVLERLEALDRDSLEQRLGPWLTRLQIKTLLKRRDLVIERIDSLIELRGEDVVILEP